MLRGARHGAAVGEHAAAAVARKDHVQRAVTLQVTADGCAERSRHPAEVQDPGQGIVQVSTCIPYERRT